MTEDDIAAIKKWPEYPAEYHEMDAFLRDGGLPEIWYGYGQVGFPGQSDLTYDTETIQ